MRRFCTFAIVVCAVCCASQASVIGQADPWGFDSYGQVSSAPTETDFIAVAAGYTHDAALRANGQIVSWGSDAYGEVSNTPAAADFTSVVCGRDFSVGLQSNGTVVAWGTSYGGVNAPPALTGVTQVAAGEYHAVALFEQRHGGGVGLQSGRSGDGPRVGQCQS